MNNISVLHFQRYLTILFVLVTLVSSGLLIHQVRQGMTLQSDLQALFPRDEHDVFINRAADRLTKEFGNKLLLAVQAEGREQALLAADVLAQELENTDLFRISINEYLEADGKQQALLQQHRFHLLTDAQKKLLEKDDTRELVRRAQAALFGFSSSSSTLSATDDPFALLGDYLQITQPYLPGEIVDDRLVLNHASGVTVVFSVALNGDVFNLDVHQQLNAWLASTRALFADDKSLEKVELLVSGAVFHASEASANAQREITWISVGSCLGILLLFLATFRGVKTLLISLVSVAYGSAVALAFNHYFFGELHLITLVFGASLIGVAIDYSLHYLSKHQDFSATPDSLATPHSDNDRHAVLKTLLPALTLGLVTSLLGYSCLLQTELPGLRQIAGFSMVGLFGAWLFVVVLYPRFFIQPLPQPRSIINTCSNGLWKLWPALNKSQLIWVILVAVLIIAGAISQFTSSQDVRLLYKPSEQLLASEKTMHNLLQGYAPNQFFIVRGMSEEALLQNEEQFRRAALNGLLKDNAIRGYSAMSLTVPSLAQQTNNYRFLDEKIYGEQGLARSFMVSAGFGTAAVETLQTKFSTAKGLVLTPKQWLTVARPDQRVLWLDDFNGEYASVIAVRGIENKAALIAAADNDDNVIWVDRVANMSRILGSLQSSASYMLALAYIVIMALMWIYYRRMQALLLVAVPLLATALTLSILTLSGVSINLFHIFGCYLILGLGMDYSIFSFQAGGQDESCRRAILLSVLTSGLSFGLLALSSTPMVNAFGLTLLLGSLFNLLLAPIVVRLKFSMQ